jgi:HK97 gp10 family phage protein
VSKELQAWLRQAPFKMKRELAGKVKAQAEKLASAVRAAAPVESGALRDSIAVRRTRNELKFFVTGGGNLTTTDIRAGAGVSYDYARAVEFGTTKMPAHPFFYSTARALEPEIQQALEEAVAEALNK